MRIIRPAKGSFMRPSIPRHTIQKFCEGGGLLGSPVNFPPIDMIADPSRGGMISNPDRSLGILLSPSERADVVMIPRGAVGDEVF